MKRTEINVNPQEAAQSLRNIQHSLNLLMAFALERGGAEGINPAINDLVTLNSITEQFEDQIK